MNDANETLADAETPETPDAPQAAAVPAAPEAPKDNDQNLWAMLCHLTAFSGYVGVPFGHIVGPLIIWLIKKGEMALVDDQGKESLNFQITMTIAALICLPLCLIVIGFFLVIAVGIFDLVCVILASIAANKGEKYRYPFAIRFIK
jgi:uncharacterized Tic20 family protein